MNATNEIKDFFYILDKDKNIIPESDPLAWGEWMENVENRRIAADEVRDIRISTVFLGTPYGFRKDKPKLFETMTFTNDYMPTFGILLRRYCTLEEALKGHEETIEFIKNNTSISSQPPHQNSGKPQ